jgi:hypothetical protein
MKKMVLVTEKKVQHVLEAAGGSQINLGSSFARQTLAERIAGEGAHEEDTSKVAEVLERFEDANLSSSGAHKVIAQAVAGKFSGE